MLPGELLSSVNEAELTYLMAFHGREGFASERTEQAIAQLCCLVKGALAKKGTQISILDFLPHHRAWEELEAQHNPARYEIEHFKAQFQKAGISVVTRKRGNTLQ